MQAEKEARGLMCPDKSEKIREFDLLKKTFKLNHALYLVIHLSLGVFTKSTQAQNENSKTVFDLFDLIVPKYSQREILFTIFAE